ncbi:MAG: RNA polymerase sigma factor [Chitinophagales bacterium]|nr:RNA polymerase sigma factor [Chitinophagales bacterium]
MTNSEFNVQVNNLSKTLKGFAYQLTRDLEDAKDLIQDTVCKALVNREKFNAGTNLKAWLYTIMRNIFINNYRRTVKQRMIVNEEKSLMMTNLASRTASNLGESALISREIIYALESIDDAIRTPFVMHFNGFKYDEIAEEMRIPLGTVKSRIFFARKELQGKLRHNKF